MTRPPPKNKKGDGPLEGAGGAPMDFDLAGFALPHFHKQCNPQPHKDCMLWPLC